MALEARGLMVLFGICCGSSFLVALLVFQRQNVKGGVALALLMLEFSLWAGANAVRFSVAEPASQALWLRLSHALLAPAPLTFFIFVAQLTDADRWLTNFNLLLLAVEPFLTVFFIATNEAHGLYYGSFQTVEIGGVREIAWGRGPWFWVNTVASYLFILATCITLVRAALRAGPFVRLQLLTVLAGCLLPWAVNVYALFRPGLARQLELTPVAATASGLIFAYALFRRRLLDIAPVARSALFEKLGDAVLVVDAGGRLVDFNAAAQQLLQLGGDASGRTLGEVAPGWRDLAAQLKDFSPQDHIELQGRLDPGRFYDVSVSPLRDSRDRRSGYLVSLREVTERKQAEMEAKRMNLRLRRQVRKISSLHAELREQAIRDALTGLYNRRYLDETLEREFSRARRGGYPISIIMADVDDFKRVNDTYGHKAGDRVLEALGEVIRRQVRAGDIPCRYGGEEFVIVMPETPLETALERAEQIRLRFDAARFFRAQGGVVPTLSIGVAAYPADGRNPGKVLHAADQAMYRAKSRGGDRALHRAGRQKTAQRS